MQRPALSPPTTGSMAEPSWPEASRFAPVSGWRAAWLLVKLRFVRFVNRASAGFFAAAPRTSGKKREQSPRGRSPAGVLMLAAVAAFMMSNSLFLSWNVLKALEREFGTERLAQPASLLFLVLAASVLVGKLGPANRELVTSAGDLESLLSLPASIGVLHAAKIAELTFGNAFGWFWLFPFVTSAGLYAGHGFLAPLFALATCLLLFPTLAVAQLWIEAASRRWLPRVVLRPAQVAAGILAIAGFFFANSPQFTAYLPRGFVTHGLGWATHLGWFPFAEPVKLVLVPRLSAAGALPPLFGFVLENAVAAGAGFWALDRMHAGGVVPGRALSGARRGSARKRTSNVARCAFQGIVGRDLRWLLREQGALGSALFFSGFCFGMAVLADRVLSPGYLSDPRRLAAAAFASGILLLSIPALNAFRADGSATWILFTTPVPLSRVLLQKALIWTAPAAAAASLTLLYGTLTHPVTADHAVYGSLCLSGVVLYAFVATALSVHGFHPGAERSALGTMARFYGFSLLASTYAGGFFTSFAWQALPLLVLTAAMTLAIWQNALRKLPILLDPHSSAPPSVLLSDGLMSALFFVALQAFFAGSFATNPRLPAVWQLFIGFAAAGLLTAIGAACVLARRGLSLLRVLGFVHGLSGARPVTVARKAAFWAALASVAVFAFDALLRAMPRIETFVKAHGTRVPELRSASEWLSFVAITLVLAPLFEETVFRGLIQRALRASFGPAATVLASAAVFAAVHPVGSAPAVFVLGLCAAMAFERSASLWAPIAVHIVYNTVVLWLAAR